MVCSIKYDLPTHRLFPPKHKKVIEAERTISRAVSNPRERLSIAVHEASHALVFRKFGIGVRYGGPEINHDCPTDIYSVTYGTAQVRDKDYLRLAANPENFARVLVAGAVAERVLMGHVISSCSDFEDFLRFAKGKSTADIIGIWKAVEEDYCRELSRDLNQQREIVHEAEIFHQTIFGIDSSIREVSNSPAREIAAV